MIQALDDLHSMMKDFGYAMTECHNMTHKLTINNTRPRAQYAKVEDFDPHNAKKSSNKNLEPDL